MRVFNLTDVPTKVLEQQGLVNQHIAVGRRMVVPGEYADVEDTDGVIRSRLVHLLTVGALAIDRVTPAYAQARQTQGGHLGSIPVRHVTLNETKVVADAGAPETHTEVPVPVTRHNPMEQASDPEPVPVVITGKSGKKRTAG